MRAGHRKEERARRVGMKKLTCQYGKDARTKQCKSAAERAGWPTLGKTIPVTPQHLCATGLYNLSFPQLVSGTDEERTETCDLTIAHCWRPRFSSVRFLDRHR